MATDLRLIRHGESVANTRPIIAGMLTDAGLSAHGRAQATLLEDRLRDDDWTGDVLYASTLPRAVQTAEYASRGLGLRFRRRRGFRSCARDWLTVCRCLNGVSAIPGSTRARRTGPFQRFAPDGESWSEFVVRAGTALTRILERHPDQSVVVVTHGSVIEASFHLALSLGSACPLAAFSAANTSITHWRYHPVAPVGLPWSWLPSTTPVAGWDDLHCAAAGLRTDSRR